MFAVEDTFEGVVLSTFHSSPVHPRLQASQQFTLQGQHLSQECGQEFFRCQVLFRETLRSADGSRRTVVFVPLVAGLAIVGISRDDATAQYHTELHTVLETFASLPGISCSPSAVYKILDGYFVVCSNQTTNFVSVFEVQLNRSSLQSSRITYPTNEIIVPASVGNIANASNFLHVEIDPNHEYIVFAVGTVIYTLRPFIYASGPLGNDIPIEFCDRVHTLVHHQGAVFYAYCNQHFFTYDIGEEDWLFRDTFARSGIPYQCPRQETVLRVFSNHIQFALDGQSNEDVEIEGEAYRSGVCFGNSTLSYFAFRDGSLGVFALSLEAPQLVPVVTSSSACHGACYPLVAVDNRYLVARDKAARKVLVLDFQGRNLGQNLTLIEARHVTPALATVLVMECPVQEAPPTTASVISTVTTVPTGPVSSTHGTHATTVQTQAAITQAVTTVQTQAATTQAITTMLTQAATTQAATMQAATTVLTQAATMTIDESDVPGSNVGMVVGISLSPVLVIGLIGLVIAVVVFRRKKAIRDKTHIIE